VIIPLDEQERVAVLERLRGLRDTAGRHGRTRQVGVMPRGHGKRVSRCRSVAAAGVAAVLACAGCGDDPEPTATSTPTPTATPEAAPEAASIDGCVSAGAGVEVAGGRAVVGRGRAGAVTVSGPGGDACQWLELSRGLARQGLRVQISETGVGDTPAKVRANVRRLRRDGARDVALLSTSAGSAAAIDAALRDTRIVALVTLSAVRFADGTDGARKAGRLALPMLHIGSREDSYTNAGADTRRFGRAGEAVLFDGSAHGTDLVAEHPELVDRIARFLHGG
jgi:hypothetical protein